MAAMLSPLFKVREFVISDFVQHNVDVVYTPNTVVGEVEDLDHPDSTPVTQHAAELKRISVFQAWKSKLTTAKVMSFLRREPLEFVAEAVPQGASSGRVLGRYCVDLPAELLVGSGAVKVKVRALLTGHATFAVENYMVFDMHSIYVRLHRPQRVHRVFPYHLRITVVIQCLDSRMIDLGQDVSDHRTLKIFMVFKYDRNPQALGFWRDSPQVAHGPLHLFSQ